MKGNIIIYIAVMAVVTYLIRMLPLVLLRRKITNRFFRSFLYYVPFVTLSVMTFPAILYSTGSVLSASVGFAVAMCAAFLGGSLPVVSVLACAVVFILELFI